MVSLKSASRSDCEKHEAKDSSLLLNWCPRIPPLASLLYCKRLSCMEIICENESYQQVEKGTFRLDWEVVAQRLAGCSARHHSGFESSCTSISLNMRTLIQEFNDFRPIFKNIYRTTSQIMNSWWSDNFKFLSIVIIRGNKILLLFRKPVYN